MIITYMRDSAPHLIMKDALFCGHKIAYWYINNMLLLDRNQCLLVSKNLKHVCSLLLFSQDSHQGNLKFVYAS